ncbi:MAG: 2-iminoacetate synthase ThiH [Verrucomicrobiota bacterium]|nr:2-iminoacetate synthase ThiH [Limisphaera sp.]MDW8381842.1 2-iminoacetate synthase ThiH [Verrucomicrobiota bacterium]
MSFATEFDALPLPQLVQRSRTATRARVRESLERASRDLNDFAHLISPAAGEFLEEIARRSHALTVQRFGRVIRLFAPLYLSNECINVCQYCGFSRNNPILRVTLTLDEVRQETLALKGQGFRNLLLVAGEHPKFVSTSYLRECVQLVHQEVPSVSLEVGPLSVDEYRPLVQAGAEGLVVYQETYDRRVYAEMHLAGPKRDFQWRLTTPERAYAAGFRRLGIGALYGLADWRYEALAVAAHASYLLRHCWKAFLTISLPRLRPCAGEFQPRTTMTDRELVQLVCAFRLMFPDVGLVLSTRESPRLRDGLIPLGITLISAGSHTEPGGYTGAGRGHVHKTVRGRIMDAGSSEWAEPVPEDSSGATEQFAIADPRPVAEVVRRIMALGYEPVWKDWDAALCGPTTSAPNHVPLAQANKRTDPAVEPAPCGSTDR